MKSVLVAVRDSKGTNMLFKFPSKAKANSFVKTIKNDLPHVQCAIQVREEKK